jgi:Na+:H+ antiporter, NhaA family
LERSIAYTQKIRHHFTTPFRDLLKDSRATGVLLMGCAFISLCLSNGARGARYMSLWNSKMAMFNGLHLPDTLSSWVNNFAMAFFFVLVTAEIKRELVAGELSSFKKAILPVGAAFGGMMVPALLFIVFNLHTGFSHGWGIPTATDIAFSLAAASLLGKRFPVKLKILLMALAIIDDLGAILVIAVFYGGHLQWSYLVGSGLIYLLLLGCRYFKIKFGILQVLLGLGLWYTLLQSGVEASIAGVLFALAMPIGTLSGIEKVTHKYVNFLVLPLFALANTAMVMPSNVFDSLHSNIGMGIICGLVIGKPLGIFLVSRVMVGLKIARLPANVNWKQFLGMGSLAGIGFTVSTFTAMLAFSSSGPRDIAKIAVLASIAASVAVSFVYFWIIGLRKVKIRTPSLNRSIESTFVLFE